MRPPNDMILNISLRSEGTFGRGDGVAGLLDIETEYDEATGLPYIRGRRLKGLLVECCADLLFGQSRGGGCPAPLETAAGFLFGRPGSRASDKGRLHVGTATMPTGLAAAIREEVRAGRLDPMEVLETLTTIRRQTALGDRTGAPEDGSLRSARCVLRGTTLAARLSFREPPDDAALGLLAACVSALHRGGSVRNRGRGRLRAGIAAGETDVTAAYLDVFEAVIRASSRGTA